MFKMIWILRKRNMVQTYGKMLNKFCWRRLGTKPDKTDLSWKSSFSLFCYFRYSVLIWTCKVWISPYQFHDGNRGPPCSPGFWRMPEAQILLKQPKKGRGLWNYDVFGVNFWKFLCRCELSTEREFSQAGGLKGRGRQFASHRRAACMAGMLRAARANECPLVAIGGTCQGHTVNLRELWSNLKRGQRTNMQRLQEQRGNAHTVNRKRHRTNISNLY